MRLSGVIDTNRVFGQQSMRRLVACTTYKCEGSANQARSPVTVANDASVETRMAPVADSVSRPYNLERMNGPVPVGSALISTAVFAQTGGRSVIVKTSRAVIAGCASSLSATRRPITPGSKAALRSARNKPRATRAHGVAAELRSFVKFAKASGTGRPDAAKMAPPKIGRAHV